jgi:hypothetical protein
MTKISIYLDDVRTPTIEGWKVVRNYEEFVSTVMYHGLENIEVISLDHDLGDQAMVEYYTNVKNNYQLDYSNIQEKKEATIKAGYLYEIWIYTKDKVKTVEK